MCDKIELIKCALNKINKKQLASKYGDKQILLKLKTDDEKILRLQTIKEMYCDNEGPDFIPINETLAPPKDLDSFYVNQLQALWTVDDVQIDPKDMQEFKKLDSSIKNVFNSILMFFTVADKIVLDNISVLQNTIYDRANNFYALQAFLESIHDQIYVKAAKEYYFITESDENRLRYENDTQLLQNIIALSKNIPSIEFNIDQYECEWLANKTEDEKRIFKAISKKINLMNKWRNVNSYVHSLVAFFIIESLCFSPLFTIIRLFKQNSKGLTYIVDINNRVEIDEKLHAEYGMTLYKSYVRNQLSNHELKNIIKEIADVELEFLSEILPEVLVTKPKESFLVYTKIAANNIYKEVYNINDGSYEKIYEVDEEVDASFKNSHKIPIKSNFFERQPIYLVTATPKITIEDLYATE